MTFYKANVKQIIDTTISSIAFILQSLRPSAQLFPQISRVLKLTRVQEVVFGVALLNSSNTETKTHATQFVKQKLPDLIRSYVDSGIFCKEEREERKCCGGRISLNAPDP